MVLRGPCVRYFTEFGHIMSLLSLGLLPYMLSMYCHEGLLHPRFTFWVEPLSLPYSRLKVLSCAPGTLRSYGMKR